MSDSRRAVPRGPPAGEPRRGAHRERVLLRVLRLLYRQERIKRVVQSRGSRTPDRWVIRPVLYPSELAMLV